MRSLGAWMARHGTVILIVAIGLLLPTLAVLQYRWTGEITQLEQLRTRTNLSAAAQQFSTQFDAMLAGIYTEYHDRFVDNGPAEAHAPLPALPGGVRHADLAAEVLLVDRLADGSLIFRDGTTADGHAVVPPPAWFEPDDLERTLLDDPPAMVVPRGRETRDRWAVVLLDTDRLMRDVLPALIAGCVEGGLPLEYDTLVVRDDDPARVLYRSRAEVTDHDVAAGVTLAPLFAVHARDLAPDIARTILPDAAAHRWRFSIAARQGALEAAVGSARARNLGVGAAVLALLALSTVLLVASAHRAQRSARQQLEMVARMSHELRTPLATITCAGENLADNVVDNSMETRQYGRIIQQEGTRLNKTIADILLCCRLQIRADAALNLAPVDLAGVIELAIQDSLAVTGEPRSPLQRVLEPGLPPVMADAEALRVAFKNLVVNALRHGQGTAVRVSARALKADGTQVVVDVDDEGPGIPEDELPSIFESFFRGRGARDGQVEGSGIGLSVVHHVVRAHHGQVRASRLQPRGTRFSVQLPALGRSTARRSSSAA